MTCTVSDCTGVTGSYVLCFVLTCFVGLIELEKVSGSNEFHMIAQIDDSRQVIIEHIRVHDEHGHA